MDMFYSGSPNKILIQFIILPLRVCLSFLHSFSLFGLSYWLPESPKPQLLPEDLPLLPSQTRSRAWSSLGLIISFQGQTCLILRISVMAFHISVSLSLAVLITDPILPLTVCFKSLSLSVTWQYWSQGSCCFFYCKPQASVCLPQRRYTYSISWLSDNK